MSLFSEGERKAENEKTARKNRGKAFEETEEYKSLIRELRAESYFGMVRLLKPGCRTLVVLCDKETKDVLVPQFARAIWPWRKYKQKTFYCNFTARVVKKKFSALSKTFCCN